MAADPALRAVRAVVFDVFGTVVDWRGGIVREGGALGAARGWEVDWPAFADAWRGRYQPSMERVRSGERPWVPLDVLHRESLDELLAEHGLGGAAEADRAALTLAWHRLDPWPDAVPGLLRLRRSRVIAPLSNGNVALLVDMARRAGLPWDLVLSAELVERYKPHREAYLSAPRLLALEPPQVLMVAAHVGDLVAARGCGLRTALVRRPDEWGPGGRAEEAGPDDGIDLVVDSFVELADALGA
jgi:2-haloacid dehalogenase